MILFDGRATDDVWKVADSGGPAHAAKADAGETGTAWPFFLPDGRHFLFVGNGATGPKTLKVGSIDANDVKVLMPVESRVEYSAGYVFYVSQQTLMARPFSPSKLAFTGEPFPVADRLPMQNLGRADFSLSRSGDLTFMADAQEPLSKLVWVDRTGRELETIGDPALFREMALSPDGRQLAVVIDGTAKGTGYDVWVVDLKRGTRSRLTFGNDMEGWPVWSPDGQWIAYSAVVNATQLAVFKKLATGAGSEQPFFTEKNMHDIASDWSRDGKTLLVESFTLSTDNSDIISVLAATGTQTPFIRTPKPLFEGAAASRRMGAGWRTCRTNPGAGKSTCSRSRRPAASGRSPRPEESGRRGADGKKIYYETRDDTLCEVPVTLAGGKVDAGTPAKIFQHHISRVGIGARGRYVPSPDGQRFLLNAQVDDIDLHGAEVVLDRANGLIKR